ncbi:MAG: ATP-binding protein [Planctomycetota bacterium]
MTQHFSTIGIRGDRAQTKSLKLLLLSTSLVCFLSIMFPSGEGQFLRTLVSIITGSYLLSVLLYLSRSRNVDSAMYFASLGAMLSLFSHFVYSGEIFYLAISVTVPVASSIYLNVKSSILLLITYTVGVISACLIIESGIWQPINFSAGYIGNLWIATIVVALVAMTVTIASVWNRHLSNKYETIVNGYCDGIIESDQHGRIMSVSGKFFNRFDQMNSRWGGLSVLDLVDESSTEDLKQQLEGRMPFGMQTRTQLPDGEERWIRLFGATANSRSSDAPRWILGVEDINQEVLNRNRLNEVSRLESLGELCGGLAHDFNNLLTVTGIYAAMVKDPDLRQKLEHANSEAIQLTSQLLAFARQQHADKKVVDLSHYLHSIKIVIDRLVPASIHLNWDIERDCHVLFDSAEIQQVLINLVSNSIHAMPAGGELTISLSTTGRTSYSSIYDVEARIENMVELCVTDTGTGMTDEVRRRALEPFFTTKPRGEGTGIGLSTIHGLVTSCGGQVTISSVPGSGTGVTISLPLIQSDTDFWKDLEFEQNAPVGTAEELTGRILLVEDREALRRAISSTLQSAGYEVFGYPDAESALEAIGEIPRIDVLVSDIVLPGISGVDLKARFREFDPRCNVILMSGYQQACSADEMNEEHGRFIRKPFLVNELIDLIESLLKQKKVH